MRTDVPPLAPRRLFCLVDCSNFYVSCERLFRPDLKHTPIAVLSNNDGCVVAHSEEVKAFGTAMGTAFFEVQLEVGGAAVFASNYEISPTSAASSATPSPPRAPTTTVPIRSIT